MRASFCFIRFGLLAAVAHLAHLSRVSPPREKEKNEKSPPDPLRHVCRLIELHTQRVNALAPTYRSRLGWGGHTMRQHEGENEGRDGKQKEQRERERRRRRSPCRLGLLCTSLCSFATNEKRERDCTHTHLFQFAYIIVHEREREAGAGWQTLSGQKNQKSLFPPSISQWGRAPALKWTPRFASRPSVGGGHLVDTRENI